MFTRLIQKELKEWKSRPDRKPLILRGARQVGKTTAIEIFSEEFENYIYLNLELAKFRNIFREEMDVQELFQAVLIVTNASLKPGKTLLFIDEIQNSAIAIKMLRYFYEEMPDLYVVCAGSLLEIVLEKADISFPVGRVEYLYIYPMSFEEYLKAKGEVPVLQAFNDLPAKKVAHSKLLKLFHEYTLIGGMPEIVSHYFQSGNIKSLDRIYESLLISYINDAEKYARNDTMQYVLRHTIESLPFESGKRIKYQGFGNSNYKSREVGESLRTIEKAMLIYLIFPSTATDLPIQIDRKKSPVLQFLDTGLLNYFIGLQPEFIRFDDLHSFYKGLIAEHIVRQEIMTIDRTKNQIPSFWVREKKQSNAEVDVITQYKNLVIPIEIKAGKTGMLRSLHQFMDAVDHVYSIRFHAGELGLTTAKTTTGKQYRLLNLPYYLAGKTFDYIEWFVEKEI